MRVSHLPANISGVQLLRFALCSLLFINLLWLLQNSTQLSSRDATLPPIQQQTCRRAVRRSRSESVPLSVVLRLPFEERARHFYPHRNTTNTCVRLCSEWGSTTIALPSPNTCDSNSLCMYRSPTGKTVKVHPFCRDANHAVCPPGRLPSCYPHVNPAYPYDRYAWTLDLFMKNFSHRTHQIHLPISTKHPFQIHSLYAAEVDKLEPSNEVFVIAPYLPDVSSFNYSITPAGCDTLHCVWEHPDGTVDTFIARKGGPTFTYCAFPKLVRPATHSHVDLRLRLSYDFEMFTPPYYFRQRSAHVLGPVFLTAVVYIPYYPAKMTSSRYRTQAALVEWIEYHILQGYDRLIIYDPTPSSDHYIDKLILTYKSIVTRLRWSPNTQFAPALAFTDAVRRYGAFTQWMTVMSIDEFMVPHPPFKSVKNILQIKYAEIPAHLRQANRDNQNHVRLQMAGHASGPTNLQDFIPLLLSPRVIFGPSTSASQGSKDISFDRCRNRTAPTQYTPNFPRATFRPRFVAGLLSEGTSDPLLTKEMGFPSSDLLPGLKLKTDGILDVYHYPYRSLLEYGDKRKSFKHPYPSAGDLKKEWAAALAHSKPFPESKNHILRFVEAYAAAVESRKEGT